MHLRSLSELLVSPERYKGTSLAMFAADFSRLQPRKATCSCLAVGRKELSGGARFTDLLKIKQTAFASTKLWGRLVCEVTAWPKNNFVIFHARRWPWLSDPWWLRACNGLLLSSLR